MITFHMEGNNFVNLDYIRIFFKVLRLYMNILYSTSFDALLEAFFNKTKYLFYLQVNVLCYRLGSVTRRI